MFSTGDSRQGPPGPPGPPGQPGTYFRSAEICILRREDWTVCLAWVPSLFQVTSYQIEIISSAFLGYGIPGPKGDKGDSAFTSSSGMIQKLNFCCFNMSYINYINDSNTDTLQKTMTTLFTTLFFTQEHFIVDHLGRLGLPGLLDLRDPQVIICLS